MKYTLGDHLMVAFSKSGYTYTDVKDQIGLSSNTMRSIFSNNANMSSVMILVEFLRIEIDLDINNMKKKQ